VALTRFCVAKWDRSLAVSDVSRLVTSHSSLHSVHYMAPSVISWTACGTRGRDRAPSTRNKPRAPAAGQKEDGSGAGVAVVAVEQRVAGLSRSSNVGEPVESTGG
jgi:hypothetical protein